MFQHFLKIYIENFYSNSDESLALAFWYAFMREGIIDNLEYLLKKWN